MEPSAGSKVNRTSKRSSGRSTVTSRSEADPRTGKPRQLSGFSELKDDGTTACGCWIYSGVFPEPGRNRARERKLTDDPLHHDWGFAWPQNRRVMYNRASAAPDGQPWSQRKKLIWWDPEQRRWVGQDEPDFEPEKPPDYQPPPGARGMAALAGTEPFIMKPDGVGWLYAPGTLKDGPLPTHYEPVESPVGNLLYPRQRRNPAALFFPGPLNPIAHAPTAEYPVVATTFRLTEHYLSGPMSRFNSWLNELQPEMFVELSPELAAERGIVHGGWLTVQTPRGRIETRAMVTRRLRPLLIDGSCTYSPNRYPPPLGLPRRGRWRRRERSDGAGGRPQREHARGQGVRLPGERRPVGWPHAEPDQKPGPLADARPGPRHAGGRPAGREVWRWQVEKRNSQGCPPVPKGGTRNRRAAGWRRC